MRLEGQVLRTALLLTVERLVAAEEELCALDWAIGDGDHGTNMRRGAEALRTRAEEIAALPPAEALAEIGRTLVMSVGGASGPLYGSLFLAAGAAYAPQREAADILAAGVAAVAARGRSTQGEKTLLDVLYPAVTTLRAEQMAPDLADKLRRTARQAAEATAPMLATKGRAAYLGARSVGHVDPGARSCCLIVEALCDILERRQ
jgi:phosphoenolpyruvate---glycerone phosphotransferase subunit DhaL